MANGANAYGLGLNNSGDRVSLRDGEGREVADWHFDRETDGDAGGASWTRHPELTGTFVAHWEAGETSLPALFSPGLDVTGSPFCERAPSLSLVFEPQEIWESGDAVVSSTLTVTRKGPLEKAVNVWLSATPRDQLLLPAGIEIPAGTAMAAVSVQARDDRWDDGDVLVSVEATTADHLKSEAQILVRDDGDPPVDWTINELDATQAGEDLLESVELYDGGLGRVPLDDLVLVFFNGATAESYDAP